MNQELAILLSARDQASRVFNQVGQSAQQLSEHLNTGLGGAIRTLGSIAGAPARALGGLTDVFGRIGLAVFGVKETIEVFKGAIEGLIGPAEEMQKRQAQLNAVIASTGGVAGVTAGAANDLAESLSKVTTFSAASNIETENLLLTFTKIGKDIFPQATETVLNMATALGEDTKSAAIQLGKALQDPVLGITALRRVGVNFSDAQKEVVKQMVASGNAAGAQALIMKELQTEFGNSARAAGQTFAGKLAILGNQFEHLKEVVGAAVLPVLGQLLDAVTPLLAELGDALPGAIDKARGVLKSLGAVIQPIGALLGNLGKYFLAVVQDGDTLNDWLSHLPAVVQPVARAFGEVIAFVGTALPRAWEAAQAVVAAFTTDAGALGVVLDDVRAVFGDTVANAIEPFVNMVMGAIDPLKSFASAVADIGQALLGGDFSGALDKASTLLQGMVDSISGWVAGDGPGQIRDALLGLADQAWAWLKTAAGQASDALQQNVIIPIKNWVAVGGLTRLEGALLGLAAGAWSWITGAASTAAGFLNDNLLQPIRDWVAAGGPGKIADALVGLAAGVWNWVKGAGATVAGFFDANLIQPITNWVAAGGVRNVADALLGLADSAWDWVATAAGQAADKLGSIIAAIANWQSGVGQTALATALIGFANHAWDWVETAVANAAEFLGHLVDAASGWVTGGGLANMMAGLAGLVAAAWDWVLKAKDVAVDKLGGLIDAARDWVTSGGLANMASALGRLADAAWAWVSDAVTTAADKLGPILQAVRDWADQTARPEMVRIGTALGDALIQGISAGADAASKSGVLAPALDALHAQLEKVQVPENVMTTWLAWGDIVRNLSVLVNTLTGKGGAGGGGLSGLVALKQKVDDFFGGVGFTLIGAIVDQVKDLFVAIDAVTSGMARLVAGKDTFAQAIQDIGTILKNTIDPLGFFNQGVSIVQGLSDGIMSKFEFLKTTVQALGQALPQWLKDVLHISSPSLVLYEIGQNIGQGLANGINAEVRPVFDAAGHLMNGVLGQVSSYGDKIHNEVRDILIDLGSVGGASVKVPPMGGASGTPHPGGGPASLGIIPNYGFPTPMAPNPQANTNQAHPPGWMPAPLGSHWNPNAQLGTVTPVGAFGTNNFYGDNYFTGPSMLDALSTLSEMTR